ncbi:uncharacterized protein BYT42DRAFT_567367 [Radiomyces spectabilis]|uniref:uncharacterized protein n=1 Tax=Radiomyces spectabilis TaxID=64574 RepID=UPI00221FA3DF|nr:uncharacterized protein BYT42DRAFT_567367 [Radiomyces spectabilis]KAI8379075.1 hypothetical protein BYT42DRAFT_567367 [Radiomyces spectabilis]
MTASGDYHYGNHDSAYGNDSSITSTQNHQRELPNGRKLRPCHFQRLPEDLSSASYLSSSSPSLAFASKPSMCRSNSNHNSLNTTADSQPHTVRDTMKTTPVTGSIDVESGSSILKGWNSDRDLLEHMNDIEQQETESSLLRSHGASRTVRTLFLGATADPGKHLLLKKLAISYYAQMYALPHRSAPDPKEFKEKSFHVTWEPTGHKDKHQIVLREYSGLLVIEADFTRSSTECVEEGIAFVKEHLHTARRTPFYTTFPETSPNGIDLCVYFYDGYHEAVDDELCALWSIGESRIPILPVVVSNDATPMDSPDYHLTEIQLKKDLAHLLASYKVQCIDFTNLDDEPKPSFKRKNPKPTGDPKLQQRMGSVWAMQQHGMDPASYPIFSLRTVLGFEQQTFADYLESKRKKRASRDFPEKALSTTPPKELSASIESLPEPTSSTLFSQGSWRYTATFLLLLVSFTLFSGSFYREWVLSKQRWTASLIAKDLSTTMKFAVEVRQKGHLQWPPRDPLVMFQNKSIAVYRSKNVGYYNFEVTLPPCRPLFHPSEFQLDVDIPSLSSVVMGSPLLLPTPPLCQQAALPTSVAPTSSSLSPTRPAPSHVEASSKQQETDKATSVPVMINDTPNGFMEWMGLIRDVYQDLGFYYRHRKTLLAIMLNGDGKEQLDA